MKIKNIIIASMIAGASLIGTTAYAAPVGKTVTVNMDNDGEGGFNAHFGNSFNGSNIGNTFVDKYLFTLSGNYDSAASVTSSFLKSGTIKDLQITNFSIVQYDPLNQSVLQTYAGSNVTTGITDHWELNATGLQTGSYYLQVDGKVIGNGGGSYGSDLTVSISAVPEPETYGMLLAGMGLLGLVARRKKAQQQA